MVAEIHGRELNIDEGDTYTLRHWTGWLEQIRW